VSNFKDHDGIGETSSELKDSVEYNGPLGKVVKVGVEVGAPSVSDQEDPAIIGRIGNAVEYES
jgi:hypothetical protein